MWYGFWLMIGLWFAWLGLFLHNIIFWIFWFIYDLFAFVREFMMWLIFYIPNLILYYWGMLMRMIFEPLDDVCIWFVSIFDDIADVLMAFVIPPTWQPAWGPEIIASFPIKLIDAIKIDALNL